MTEQDRPFRSRMQSLAAVIGAVIDPIVTVYRGITMRSRLEADFARHLDDQGIAWTYEPEVFGPRGSGYLPDFRLDGPPQPTYVEIKPTIEQAQSAKRRIAGVWATYPDALLIVVSGEECRYFAAVDSGAWTTWVERWAH